jgi:hypothetical protein
MKTTSFIKAFVMISAIALIASSCKKESVNPTPDPATVAAIDGMRTAYNNAKTYNDSLNYWYNMDSVHYVGMMNHCDSLYHFCNSTMMSNYNMMNSNGGMMGGSSTNGGMMGGSSTNGGMMGGNTTSGTMMGGNNTTVNCTINGTNCTTMINSLHKQHIHHPRH